MFTIHTINTAFATVEDDFEAETTSQALAILDEAGWVVLDTATSNHGDVTAYVAPYRYERHQPTIEHADHNWEEWHAYLATGPFPTGVDNTATGICCHTCSVVALDETPATDDLY
jgi:hypothetical protein